MHQISVYPHLFVRTVYYFVDCLIGNILHRYGQIAAVIFKHSLYFPENQRWFCFSQRYYGTFFYRQLAVRNYFVYVYCTYVSQAFAFRTRTYRCVEREVIGRRIAIRNSRCRTHQAFRVILYATRRKILNHNQAITAFQRKIYALFKAFQIFFVYYEFVDHKLHVMVLVPVEFHSFGYLDYFAVHPHVQETSAPLCFEQFFVMPFPVAHQRSEDIYLVFGVILHYKIQQLLTCVANHLLAGYI